MVLSSEGLHLLSNVAVWRHDFETINDKNVAMWHRYYIDVINFYIMKENHREWIDNDNKNKRRRRRRRRSTQLLMAGMFLDFKLVRSIVSIEHLTL